MTTRPPHVNVLSQLHSILQGDRRAGHDESVDQMPARDRAVGVEFDVEKATTSLAAIAKHLEGAAAGVRSLAALLDSGKAEEEVAPRRGKRGSRSATSRRRGRRDRRSRGANGRLPGAAARNAPSVRQGDVASEPRQEVPLLPEFSADGDAYDPDVFAAGEFAVGGGGDAYDDEDDFDYLGDLVPGEFDPDEVLAEAGDDENDGEV